MALHVCIVLRKSTVLTVRDVEAPNGDAALIKATAFADVYSDYTRIELWLGGQKVRTYQRPPPGNKGGSAPSRQSPRGM